VGAVHAKNTHLVLNGSQWEKMLLLTIFDPFLQYSSYKRVCLFFWTRLKILPYYGKNKIDFFLIKIVIVILKGFAVGQHNLFL